MLDDNLISDMSFEKSAADAKARIRHLKRVIQMLADENKRLRELIRNENETDIFQHADGKGDSGRQKGTD